MKKRLFLFLIFLFGRLVFADLPKPIIDAQIQDIKSKVAADEIYSAFEETNVLLRSFENPEFFPGNVTAVSILVYEKYIKKIDETKKYRLIEEVDSNLKLFSGISSPIMQTKVNKIKEKFESQKFDEQKQNQASALNSIKTWLVLIFIGLVLLALLIFVPVFLISKKSRKQMKDFDRTLRQLAGLQKKNNQILLDALTDIDSIQSQNQKSLGWGTDVLPAPEMSDEEKSEMRNLALECEKLGEQIDKVTDRKNNSKNVSELVYKLSVRLGLNQNSAKLYFCAAMVYDAGFLSLPKDLLKSENLDGEQKKLLKTHALQFGKYLGFVPKKFWKTFEDAAMYHHENIDGSGYPEGISGGKIPQVARLIHVAESYVSLVSSRTYKKITDKESAVKELESKPQLYDAEVVKALDGIL